MCGPTASDFDNSTYYYDEDNGTIVSREGGEVYDANDGQLLYDMTED